MSDFLKEINNSIDTTQDRQPEITEPLTVSKVQPGIQPKQVTKEVRPEWMNKPYVAPYSVKSAPED